MSSSTFEYVIRHLFIHLDDQNPKVQMAVYHLILKTYHLHPEIVLTEAQKSVKNQTYPQKCKEIIKIISESLLEKKEGS